MLAEQKTPCESDATELEPPILVPDGNSIAGVRTPFVIG